MMHSSLFVFCFFKSNRHINWVRRLCVIVQSEPLSSLHMHLTEDSTNDRIIFYSAECIEVKLFASGINTAQMRYPVVVMIVQSGPKEWTDQQTN